MSSDIEVGEMDCKYFFPTGYTIKEEEVPEVKKKSKKKTKQKPSMAANQEETTSVATSDLMKEQSEIDHDEILEQESDEDKDIEMCDDVTEEKLLGSDKATSPIEYKIESEANNYTMLSATECHKSYE